MKVNPTEFIHPEDAEALRQMESIAGFPTLLKKFYRWDLSGCRSHMRICRRFARSWESPVVQNVAFCAYCGAKLEG